MSCDINFKSQEHLKNLGTAVEIVSVYTDLHRHIVPIKGSTKFPEHCDSVSKFNTIENKH